MKPQTLVCCLAVSGALLGWQFDSTATQDSYVKTIAGTSSRLWTASASQQSVGDTCSPGQVAYEFRRNFTLVKRSCVGQRWQSTNSSWSIQLAAGSQFDWRMTIDGVSYSLTLGTDRVTKRDKLTLIKIGTANPSQQGQPVSKLNPASMLTLYGVRAA